MNPQFQEKIQARKEILDAIKEELIDRLQLEYEVEDIDDDTYLFGSGLALDSIDAMEIVIALQSRFDVEVPEGNTESLRTVNTLADLVQRESAH
ncbi:MAG: acyl carrier protein [Pseudomonadota bacterium]|nr:acyl carrier protein [Pseudomonadales bacterium]MDY6921024.1 acyl carrier protein [Pseudomonadota bacterium]|tara:strand:+ start:20 stop:301 length:282 start_codon:yes stop_codon:yes gene_type:complete